MMRHSGSAVRGAPARRRSSTPAATLASTAGRKASGIRSSTAGSASGRAAMAR
jgi:hypothetical protein